MRGWVSGLENGVAARVQSAASASRARWEIPSWSSASLSPSPENIDLISVISCTGVCAHRDILSVWTWHFSRRLRVLWYHRTRDLHRTLRASLYTPLYTASEHFFDDLNAVRTRNECCLHHRYRLPSVEKELGYEKKEFEDCGSLPGDHFAVQ